jgi:hypothetical protein
MSQRIWWAERSNLLQTRCHECLRSLQSRSRLRHQCIAALQSPEETFHLCERDVDGTSVPSEVQGSQGQPDLPYFCGSPF